jgi:4-amino-4-deoxy-L-arabinose transferase-like glycosyltransferase
VNRRTTTVFIVLLALLPALTALHSRSFFSPDETSYAQVAREMVQSGDFVVPTIDGRPWLEKPPLMYWLLVIAFAIFGWGFPAAVVLNALLTAATALVIAAYVRRQRGPRAAVLSAAAYLTMFLPIAAARTGLTDPALTLCTTVAIVLFLSMGTLAGVGAGVLLGLGALAKGPVAPLVVLPAMLAVSLVRRRRAEWARLAIAIVAGCAVALPWHLALAGRGLWHEFFAVFFGHQVLSRAVEAWGIGSPWWFYAPALWLAAFPWGTHLVLAFRDQRRRLAGSRWQDAGAAAEAAAVAVPLIAFSVATNKLPHYVLPILPWLAVWLGRTADRVLSAPKADRWARTTAWGAAILAAGALAALALELPHWQMGAFLPPLTSPVLAGSALLFAVLGIAEGLGKRRAAWVGLASLTLVLRLGLDISLLPFVDRKTVERPLAAAVQERLPPNGLPVAHRWWRASFVAYGVRGWARTESQNELEGTLATAARAGRPVLVLVRADREGEVRAAAWNAGGNAREVAQLSGLGEIDGKVLEGILFLAERTRDDTRFFYDADRKLPGEEGFDGLEGNQWTPSFRWSVTLSSRLPIPARPPGEAALRLRAWGREHRGETQRLGLVLNGCSLGEVTLGRFPEVFAIPVPARCLHGSPQELILRGRHLDIPRESGPGSSDVRTLVFALDWLALDPTPTSPRHSETSRYPTPGSVRR